MKIVKWLKDDEDKITKVEWQVIPTTLDDDRGYTIGTLEGKWLTVVSTFIEDAGKDILSISPFNNPGLSKYTEISEEEANYIQEHKRKQEAEKNNKLAKLQSIKELNNALSYHNGIIDKYRTILNAVKSNVLYNGDLHLMEAVHGFNEDSIYKEEEIIKIISDELSSLEDGE